MTSLEELLGSDTTPEQGVVQASEAKPKRHFRLTFNAPVTLIFIFICFIATALNLATAGASNEILFSTYHSSLFDPLTWVRFFTHAFGHSGWDHFIGNSVYLLLLGPLLEEKYGSKMLVVVIAVTAFVTGVANYIFFPNVMLCGASGVVFAFILLSSFAGFKDGEIPLTFVLVVVFFLGQQVYQGLFVEDSISHFTHIIGGIVGAVIGYIYASKSTEEAASR